MAEKTKDVIFKHEFEHRAQQRLVLLLVLVIAVNFFMACYLMFIMFYPVEPKYYSTSVNSKVMPLDGLSEPNLSDYAVLQWANQAAVAAFTYDFLNYNSQLILASQYFTAAGWDEFVAAILEANSVEVVEQKKLVVSSVATKPPIILQKGVVNGIYSWRIQMPILITYRSASEVTPENHILTMLVTRVSTLETYKGIGIAQFNIG